MYEIFKLNLLLTFLLHSIFVARCAGQTTNTVALNISNLPRDTPKMDNDLHSNEAQWVNVPITLKRSLQEKFRTRRQLFVDPNLFFLPAFGREGSRCFTGHGIHGVCVRIDDCSPYYRVERQLAFYEIRNLVNSLGANNNAICMFIDTFGRANSGICCTRDSKNGYGINYTPVLIPKPMPTQPYDEKRRNQTEAPALETENLTALDEAGSDINTDVIDTPELTSATESIQDNDFSVENDLQDSVNVPAPLIYDDTRQWTAQFGNFGAQWPPVAPIHPPSVIGSWPPPIPTHPPNHHYPTHPPSTGDAKPTMPAMLTTKRLPTTTYRPSYPNYPSYPLYRPTFSPITTKRPATTMRPSSTGNFANGLPLQCGIKNPTSPDQERIVGGTNASPYEFPWIAVLFKGGKQFCGGSLITKEHILTAAHCVARMTSWDVAALTAHLGDYNIRTDFEVKHVTRRIKRLVRHKGFDFSTLHNDIAILTLSEPVQFSYEVQPVCLPTSPTLVARSFSGQTATVAGWGSLRENGPQPSILQKVEIPIWTNSECARKYGHAAPAGIIDSMICAGQSAKDSCSGDSGGPLIINEGGRYMQVGIVSWGIGCGKGQYPGVYTRVTSLLPWIYKNIK